MIQTILLKYLKDAAPALLQERFDKAAPGVVRGMQSKGLSPETTTLEVLVRDALFRLIRSVVPSGDISDLIRDHIDGPVVRLVQQQVTGDDLLDLAAIVRATGRACVAVTF